MQQECWKDGHVVFGGQGNGSSTKIVAMDYGGYSFLPPSFFALALRHGAFAHKLAAMLQYPLCQDNTKALVSASCALAPFSSNNIGEQISLLSLLFCFLPLAPLQEHRADYTAQAFRNGSSPGLVTERGTQLPSSFPRRTRLRSAFSQVSTRWSWCGNIWHIQTSSHFWVQLLIPPSSFQIGCPAGT